MDVLQCNWSEILRSSRANLGDGCTQMLGLSVLPCPYVTLGNNRKGTGSTVLYQRNSFQILASITHAPGGTSDAIPRPSGAYGLRFTCHTVISE
jgi:hypothetical protein